MDAVRADPVLRIGDVTGEHDAYTFTEINDIAVLGDSILVVDGLTNEIRVFDHDARLLGRLGGDGEGPGEFRWLTHIRVDPDGLEAVDLGLRRRTFFTPDGEVVRAEPIGRPGGLVLSDFAGLRGGWGVGETAVRMSAEEGAHPRRMLVLTGPRNDRIDTLAAYFVGYIPFAMQAGYGFLDWRSGSGGGWDVAGDSLVVIVSGDPVSVRWWRAEPEGLGEVGRIRLPIGPESFTRSDQHRFLAHENRALQERGGEPLPGSAEIGWPGQWGQVKQVVISDDQRCWIQWDEPRTEEDRRWFVLDLRTARVIQVALPRGFRLEAAVDGRLYGYRLNELDVPLVEVYRLEDGIR